MSELIKAALEQRDKPDEVGQRHRFTFHSRTQTKHQRAGDEDPGDGDPGGADEDRGQEEADRAGG